MDGAIGWSASFLEKYEHVLLDRKRGLFRWGLGTVDGELFDDYEVDLLEAAVSGNPVLFLRYYRYDSETTRKDEGKSIVEFARSVADETGLQLVSVREPGEREIVYSDGSTDKVSYPIYTLDGYSFGYNEHPENHVDLETGERAEHDWLACVLKWEPLEKEVGV